MKTLLVSFVYPLIKPYLNDFFESLNKQTIDKFDTLIFKDSFPGDLNKFGYYGETLSNTNQLSISNLRKFVINYGIKNDYDLLIFIDADDVMAKDRVERLIKNYNDKISFLYNDLFLLSDPNEDFYKGKLPDRVNSLSLIEKHNFLGMSHTAINLKKENNILKDMPVYDDIIAFDWYLHSYLLLNGGNGKKINTKTYYRIYENNIAGKTNFINKDKLLTGLEVKKIHYKYMMKFDNKFKDDYKEILKLEKFLEKESNFKFYLDYINNCNREFNYWWEYILTLKQIKMDYRYYEEC